MNTQITPMRRLRARAFAVACALVILCGATLLTPAGRAAANRLLYTIGIVTVVEMPQGPADNDKPTAVPPPAEPAPQPHAADAADASQLAGFTVLDLAALPAGYAPAEDWTVITDDRRVNAVRGYADAAGHSLTVTQLKAAPGETYEWRLSPSETATPVEINGAEGLVIDGVLFGEGPFVDGQPSSFKSTTWLRWAAGDINYTLWSDGLTAEQLLEIARGME
ncbi:MAG TPA: hypothetical protein VD886_05160 [Herpetosiphonaceae bacterium]|nr:hypothetical protein [Herpetosiphonaceae bacterium]